MLTPSQIAEMAAVKYPFVTDEDKGREQYFNRHITAQQQSYISGFTDAMELMSKEWVSVEDDEIPPMEVKTQIICADGEQYIGYFNGADTKGHVWFCDNNDYHYPTHWQPLPEPPKK